MRHVSKNIFLNALACPTLGWLMRSGGITEQITGALILGERLRIEQGIEIGRRARGLYPGGLIIDETDIASASRKTRSLMNDPKVSIIFEGAFLVGGFATKADILKRKDDGWHLIEVKSSVNDREEFIDDMAYTAMVIDRCGFDISAVSLLLISKDFRLGMKDEKLFVRIDHTNDVLNRVEVFKPYWEPIEKITRKPAKPGPKLRFECRNCEIFRGCLGKDIENHIFDIPRLTQSKFDKLVESGVVRIENIPDEFPLTKNQARMRDCVRTNKPFVGDTLKNEFESISWPAYYLDFETVMTAIPLYPDIAPYTKILTQYSIHKCSEPSRVIDHFEYLADPSRDCRRELARNLINNLKGEGSIIVYGSFEKIIITGLGKMYPDLSRGLNSLIDRITDLEAIIRRSFYHPDFNGRTSIKTTLPVLVPDMSYDELEIADGDSAAATFAYLVQGKYEESEVETVKRNLLEYCKQDTLAMVRLHQRLVEYAEAVPEP